MTAALEITGLRVVRDAGVLLDVEALELQAGTLTVVTGPTDAGKTLLAAVICGVIDASEGSVLVSGRRLAGPGSARRRLGIAGIVGNGGHIAGCTVIEALRLAGSARTELALDRFAALRARAQVSAELLSGGEQQMLQVACAWAASPKVLVLDAPTTGLAADAATVVGHLATEAAGDGAAVLWLDQSAALAPVPPQWRLAAGVLSPAPAAA
jgi:branched-chain amino acid transport system ATP-binding protein